MTLQAPDPTPEPPPGPPEPPSGPPEPAPGAPPAGAEGDYGHIVEAPN